METELDRDSVVDIYNLHTEYQKQTSLYSKWGKRKSKAVKDEFLLKEKLKVLRGECKRIVEEKKAELDILFRTNYNDPIFYEEQKKKYPNQEGLLDNFQVSCEKKITEAMVNSFVTLHPEYIQIQNEMNEKINQKTLELAERIEDLGLFDTAVMAMIHRKSTIEGEINLWLGEYYSDPKVPKTYIEQEQKKVQKKLRKKLKKGD